MRGGSFEFKSCPIANTADKNETNFSCKTLRAISGSLHDCFHRRTDGGILNQWVFRKEHATTEKLVLTRMSIGVAPLSLSQFSGADGNIRTNRNDIFPRTNIYSHGLTNVLNGIFDFSLGYWTLPSFYSERQRLQYAMSNFYPRPLRYFKFICGSIGRLLGSYGAFDGSFSSLAHFAQLTSRNTGIHNRGKNCHPSSPPYGVLNAILAVMFCLRVTYRLIIKGDDSVYHLPGWFLLPFSFFCGMYGFGVFLDSFYDVLDCFQEPPYKHCEFRSLVPHGNTVTNLRHYPPMGAVVLPF